MNNRIIPPIELQKEYFDLIKKEEQVKKEEQKTHLDEIADKFQTHIEWWNKEFKYIKEDTSKRKVQDQMNLMQAVQHLLC